jgi:cysteine synthase
VDGQATAAALATVATTFGVRRHAVTLVAGASSRTKIMDVAGADLAVLDRLTGSVTTADSLAKRDDRHRRECHLYSDVLASHRTQSQLVRRHENAL